jgi:hypothetical protein
VRHDVEPEVAEASRPDGCAADAVDVVVAVDVEALAAVFGEQDLGDCGFRVRQEHRIVEAVEIGVKELVGFVGTFEPAGYEAGAENGRDSEGVGKLLLSVPPARLDVPL